jgi:two-component system chemotaxis response regulator CheB
MNARPQVKAVVMGGSAGSVASLLVILKELPADFRPAVLLTVHVPPGAKRSVLVDILQTHCQVEVTEAEDKAPIHGGTVYVAPSDYHLLVEKSGSLALSADDPVLFSRPSIDVLFESAADAYGGELAGVVLSGANHDGAHGLRLIEQAGGIIVVEDPDHAYAPVMPLAALDACPGAWVGSPSQIASYLKHL